MSNFAPHIYTFILPLFIGNVLHMLVVKFNVLAGLARPLSEGLFGSGKTWRAFMVMPLVCGICCVLLRAFALHTADLVWSFCTGAMLGVAYLIGELPNSYIKRRMGIASGGYHPRYRLLQGVIDKCDSLLCCCAVYFFMTNISLRDSAILFGVSFAIHVVFSALLVALGIKKSF